MKKMIFAMVTVILLLCVFVLSACQSVNVGTVELKYYDESDAEKGFNTQLFYRNDLLTTSADPDVVYVTEGEYAGWFFVYATSDQIGGRGIMCWKSRDLSNWDEGSICYRPEPTSWGQSAIWAPGILYDKETSKYYLYYSAENSNTAAGYKVMKYVGLAVSDSPAGPFEQWTGTNADGFEIGLGDPIVDLARVPDNPNYVETGTSFIDAKPFRDPVSGKLYLYMARTRFSHTTNVIAVYEMKDFATPDYDSYTLLTTANRTTVDGSEYTEAGEGVINEAPYMTYNAENGKYYLTFSINATTDKNYAVMQAVGDSPTGPFTKIQRSKGGTVVVADVEWDHISSCGSHCFVEADGEMWIVYHQSRDREYGGTMNRAFACDRVTWCTNDDGLQLLKAVGPTYSVQPRASIATGYKNLAPLAEVSATNVGEGSDAKYLTDGLVRFHDIDCVKEFESGKGNSVKVTLTFKDYVIARSLLLYNSYNFEYAFDKVTSVNLHFRKTVDGKTYTGVAQAKDLRYDFDTYASMSYQMMRPGAPMILEFEEMEINKVEIEFVCYPNEQDMTCISEIMLFGKEATK